MNESGAARLRTSTARVVSTTLPFATAFTSLGAFMLLLDLSALSPISVLRTASPRRSVALNYPHRAGYDEGGRSEQAKTRTRTDVIR